MAKDWALLKECRKDRNAMMPAGPLSGGPGLGHMAPEVFGGCS